MSRFGFDHGLVHYVMMSTEHDFSVGSDQYYFLKEHLASVDRSVTPWLIFTGHRYRVCRYHVSVFVYYRRSAKGQVIERLLSDSITLTCTLHLNWR